MSLRKIFYSFSPEMRIIIRRLLFAPFDLFSKQHYPNGIKVPPKSKIFTGGGDFVSTGFKFSELFQKYGGLEKSHSVLDIGSGLGRMAAPLAHFIDNNGNYEGIDIMPQGVQWCVDNISSKFPNFKFQHINLKNDLYTNTGAPADSMSLPFENDSFDFIFLISVFTHMLPLEIEQYFKEMYRCLKSGKTCFATMFLYENESILRENNFEIFIKQNEQHALMSEKVQSANVAFSFTYIKSFLTKLGFEIRHYSKGKWQGNQDGDDFQDVLVIHKPSI